MSDWRSGNNKDGSGRKENRPKPKPVSPAPPKPNPPPTPSGASPDWRGNAKRRVVASKSLDKSWTGRGREKATSTGALTKALLLGGLGLVIASLFYLYWVFVFLRDPKLPIVVSISSDYSYLDLGSNSFGAQAFELKQEKLHLFPANEPLANEGAFKLISNERFLEEVRTNDQWGQNWKGIGNYSKGPSFFGGGPSRSVTAYFISCLIAREKAPLVSTGMVGNSTESTNTTPWILLTKGDDPFGGSNNDKLSIKTLLERIAGQTAEGKFAFVVMDVKPPTVVSNLGDLAFPKKAFEEAFKEVKDQWKDRLIVCLPCDEGEENWIAPEFRSSVFAHFFWKGVSTGFEKSKRKWSVVDFQKSLKENVTNWVARHRYAKQTPTFLMSPTTEGRIKNFLFVETSGGELKIPSVDNLKSVLQKRYESLEGLWDDYETLKHCLITNPLRYATVESGLIQMEDLAEIGSESAWREFETRIREHVAKLKKDAKFDRRVSLVEAEKHSAFFREPSVFNEQADKNCLNAWNRILQAARSDKQSWAKQFSEPELFRAIENCKLDAKRTSVEWIEVRLIKLIHEAIRDIAENPKAQEAIAGIINNFSELNKIAFEPRLELSNWTGKKILSIDKLFVECFDHFYANDFDASLEKLKTIEADVSKLSEEFRLLEAAMATRDEVLWLTPHLLASQMRMSRQSDAKEDKSAADIASLLLDTIGIRDSLMDTQASPATLSLKPEAANRLEELKSKRLKAFTDVAERPADSGTLQMTRTGLRWPLLPKELRNRLHNRLTKLYELNETKMAESDGSEVTKGDWSSLTPRSVGEDFLSRLSLQGNNLERVGALYERMVKNDTRYSIPEIELDKDENGKSAQVKQRVYFESYLTRMVANSFGQRSVTKHPTGVQWPWNAPDQLQTVNSIVYNHLQCERLCLSRWGDGDLNGGIETLYFERMMADEGSFSKSFNASARLALQDFSQSKPISESLESDSLELLNRAIAEVRQLGVTVSPFELSGEAPVFLTVKQNDWNAFATVSIHGDSKSAERIPFSGSEKTNTKGMLLIKSGGQAETIQKLKLDPNLVGKQLRLGVRGHYRGSPLVQANPVKSFQLDLSQPIGPAAVRVEARDNDAITMWVLLDCSNSMQKNNIHALAKATAGQLLKQVMHLNSEGESPLQVGFIVFGRRPDADTPEILKQCTIGNQIFKSAVMKDEQIGLLVDLVASDWVKPSGCTPLYDAIFTACEESKNDGRNWIVVVSDGSNDVDIVPSGKEDDGTYYIPKKGNKQDTDVKQKVRETKSNLFVYQYSNDAYYKEAKNTDGTQKFLDYQIKEIEKANQQLRDLLNDVSPKNTERTKSKLFYSTFEELSQDLIALLPVSTITITDSNGTSLGEGPSEKQTFGKQIKINVSEPTKATLTVNRHGKKSNPVPIWLTGSEKLEFKYSDSRGLTMIPYKNDSYGFRKSWTQMAADGGNKSKVAVKATTAATAPNRLDIQLTLQGEGVETIEQTKFTRRPRFVVASVSPAGAPLNQAFWICDHSFSPDTHYPIVRFPYIPWQEDNQWRSKEVDVGIWMSDESPKSEAKISLQPGDTKDISQLKLRFVRTDDKVTVTVPDAMESHLIMCSTATKTKREYVDSRETKIVFEVPSGQAAEICVVKPSELQAWSNEGAVQHYSVSDLKFAE